MFVFFITKSRSTEDNEGSKLLCSAPYFHTVPDLVNAHSNNAKPITFTHR